MGFDSNLKSEKDCSVHQYYASLNINLLNSSRTANLKLVLSSSECLTMQLTQHALKTSVFKLLFNSFSKVWSNSPLILTASKIFPITYQSHQTHPYFTQLSVNQRAALSCAFQQKGAVSNLRHKLVALSTFCKPHTSWLNFNPRCSAALQYSWARK